MFSNLELIETINQKQSFLHVIYLSARLSIHELSYFFEPYIFFSIIIMTSLLEVFSHCRSYDNVDEDLELNERYKYENRQDLTLGTDLLIDKFLSKQNYVH